MEKNRSSESNSRSASLQFPTFLALNLQHRVHRTPLLIPILCEVSSFNVLASDTWHI
jgi:hypothetical protein